MLRALELENFKAFGEPTRIEFAPITLIFGENSAGKSSILQALNLLKQSWMHRDSGAALTPRVENGLVDLGSFQELLFDHDSSRQLSITFELDERDSVLFTRTPKQFGLRIMFAQGSSASHVRIEQIDLLDATQRLLASFNRREITSHERSKFYLNEESGLLL